MTQTSTSQRVADAVEKVQAAIEAHPGMFPPDLSDITTSELFLIMTEGDVPDEMKRWGGDEFHRRESVAEAAHQRSKTDALAQLAISNGWSITRDRYDRFFAERDSVDGTETTQVEVSCGYLGHCYCSWMTFRPRTESESVVRAWLESER